MLRAISAPVRVICLPGGAGSTNCVLTNSQCDTIVTCTTNNANCSNSGGAYSDGLCVNPSSLSGISETQCITETTNCNIVQVPVQCPGADGYCINLCGPSITPTVPPTVTLPPQVCGNGICASGESCASCPSDLWSLSGRWRSSGFVR